MSIHPPFIPTRRIRVILDTQYFCKILMEKDMRILDLNLSACFGGVFAGNRGQVDKIVWFRPAQLEGRLSKAQYMRRWLAVRHPGQAAAYIDQLNRRELPASIYAELSKAYVQAERWFRSFEQTFIRTEHQYESLAAASGNVEIIRTGYLRVDMLNQEVSGEKGVDVGIGLYIAQCAQTDACDAIALLSGDLDFVEAMKTAQRAGKHVYLAQFERSHSLSGTLRQHADRVFPIPDAHLRSCGYREPVRLEKAGTADMGAGGAAVIRMPLACRVAA